MLDRLYEEMLHPFPYSDISHIYKTVTSRKIRTRRAIDKGFIPDLDYYWSSIAGYSSWNEKAPRRDFEKRLKLARLLDKEFFAKHPEYQTVRRWITEENTPDLHRDFVLYEEMRVNALALYRLLDRLYNSSEKP